MAVNNTHFGAEDIARKLAGKKSVYFTKVRCNYFSPIIDF